MAPLIALAISALPEIGSLLFGRSGGSVGQAVQDVVQEVTGTDDPDQAREALADTGTLDALRIRLAEIAAEARRQERAADLEEMKAEIADVADARLRTQELAQAGNPMAWVPAILTFVITIGFFLAFFGIMFGWTQEIDRGWRDIALQLCGVITSAFMACIAYWMGTSRGAVQMREGFQRLSGALPGPFGRRQDRDK